LYAVNEAAIKLLKSAARGNAVYRRCVAEPKRDLALAVIVVVATFSLLIFLFPGETAPKRCNGAGANTLLELHQMTRKM
jgi:hypothetical protein